LNFDELQLDFFKEKHIIYGNKIMCLNKGKVFPCDCLYLSVLNRSLELYQDFSLLRKKNSYGTCIALLRMQLDNVLRFYGILITKDPHHYANDMINGTRLDKIKDKKGNHLKDFYLVGCLSKENPWIKDVYKIACGYIHLSENHFYRMLENSKIRIDGQRDFYLGDSGKNVPEINWNDLVKAFNIITDGVFELFTKWEIESKSYDISKLGNRYEIYV